MFEQFLAVITIILLLTFLVTLNKASDKGERIYYNLIFPLAIIGVFLGGVLDIF